MNDEERTKEQLIHELRFMRQRIAELERRERECNQVERDLRNSRERLNLALISSHAGTWDRDIVADKATWDEQLHALFGLPPGSFSGRLEDFLGMVHPDDQGRVREEMTAAMNGDADYSTTYRVIWPDSTVHFIVDRGKVYRDSAGRPVRMIGVNVDVTEMKQAEEALKESQQQLANIINFLPDATFVIDREGKVISWNRAIEEMTGIKAAEILGKRDYEYALPFHGERRPILIDLVLQRHEEFEARYEIIERKESGLAGEAYMSTLRQGGAYLFGKASILRDSKGNVVGAIESIRDISERKRAEEELSKIRDQLEDLVKERTAELARANDRLTLELADRKVVEKALRESQQMLRLVLDTIPARVFWKDLDSNYLGCNRPFALDAGVESPEEIIGRNDLDLVWAEYADLYRWDDHSVVKTGRPKLGYEETQTAVDGSTMWVRTNKVPLLDADGMIKGILGTYEDITESKRIEEMLRESETRYRIVAENTQDWEYWVSPEGAFLYTSPSCQEITGYAASEFQGDPRLFFHIIHPEDFARAVAHLQEDRTEGASGTLEFRIIHRDGSTRWMEHVCQPVFNSRGRFLGRRASNRDSTRRKQVEESLRKSEERYRELVQNANSVIIRWKSDGTITFFNEFAQKFFGWSADEIIGRHVSILLADQDLSGASLSGLVQDIVDNPEHYVNYINENICREGRRVWMVWTNRAIEDESGNVIEILAIGSDITERKRAEEALRESEAFLNAIGRMAKVGGWEFDTETLEIRWTEETYRIHDVPVGQRISLEEAINFYQPEDRERLRVSIQRALDHGEPYDIEIRLITAKANQLWTRSICTPHIVDGKTVKLSGAFQDITDRKRMEEDLLRAKEELESRVHERTIDLERANIQLRSIPSKLIAAQEDERKRIASELHDCIGQTLTGLKYGIETALDKKSRGDVAGAFELLERFVPALQHSIAETRSIYMGLRPPMIDHLGVLATLEWFCREFRIVHPNQRINLMTRINEEEISDVLKIAVFRIVQEALNNVAKHSEAKCVTISLTGESNCLELVVQDDGRGFDPDSFSPNSGIDGLGLTGMRERVELTGGVFSVESTLGEGTTLKASWLS